MASKTARRERVTVAKAALLARVNRRLAKDGEALKAARGDRARKDMGDFYVVDAERKSVLHKDVDPAELARELGVLKGYETAPDFE